MEEIINDYDYNVDNDTKKMSYLLNLISSSIFKNKTNTYIMRLRRFSLIINLMINYEDLFLNTHINLYL